mgnify:CR=1 FL=1|tara:strand:- start:764 stop:1063 length:300 start_codon:yes stop_codon:yes gene_type:complete
MFLITIEGMGPEGAYAVRDERNNNVLYLFIDKDDAMRYASMLEAEETFPPMSVTEVEDRQVIATCEHTNCKYSIITPDELVIPLIDDDPISEDKVEEPS